MAASRVGRLFVVEMNLRFLREKFDSHAKPHARTIKSGWRTVARAVASRHNAMNFRTRFETQTPGVSETNKSTCKSVCRRMTPTDVISLSLWYRMNSIAVLAEHPWMMHFLQYFDTQTSQWMMFKMASYIIYCKYIFGKKVVYILQLLWYITFSDWLEILQYNHDNWDFLMRM